VEKGEGVWGGGCDSVSEDDDEWGEGGVEEDPGLLDKF